MDNLHRLLILPFLAGAVAWLVLAPLGVVEVYLHPNPEKIFTALSGIGLYPMALAMLQAARIEHFMIRSIDPELDSRTASMLGGKFRQVWRAGEMLSEVLQSRRKNMDAAVVNRSERLIRQHRVLTRLIWPGVALAALGGLGLSLLEK